MDTLEEAGDAVIRETTLLEVTCDGCRTAFCLFDEYETYRFSDERDIPVVLSDHEWSLDGGHFCPTCECGKTGHELKAFRRGYGSVGYKSCDCGENYEKAITVNDILGRV